MKYLIAVGVLLVAPTFVNAEDLSDSQREELTKIENAVQVVLDLEKQNLITADQSKNLQKHYTDAASQIMGRPVTLAEVDQLVHSKTYLFNRFLNIVLVFAAVLLVISIVGLFTYYLWPLLGSMPGELYELCGYVLSFGMMLAPYYAKPFSIGAFGIDPFWGVVPGAMLFFATFIMTCTLHFNSGGSWSWPFVVTTVIYTVIAYNLHQSFNDATSPYILGFMAVMALEAALGFSIFVIPGCVFLGWEEESMIARSTWASLLIMFFYLISQLNPQPIFEVFKAGFLFMGAFVYYLGLLVCSSQYYFRRDERFGGHYWVMQLITIASGILAFYIGTVFGVGVLLGVGGTFFTLYFIEKYYEIPWKGAGWYWSSLGLAVAIYFFVGFAKNNPQYFLWNY